MKSYGVTIQMKPLQQYFNMVIIIYYVVIPFLCVDEILWCYHLLGRFLHSTIYFLRFYKTKQAIFFHFYHYYNRLDYQPFPAPVFLPRGGYKPDSETPQTPGRPRFLECPPLAVKPPFNFSQITNHGLKGSLNAKINLFN